MAAAHCCGAPAPAMASTSALCKPRLAGPLPARCRPGTSGPRLMEPAYQAGARLLQAPGGLDRRPPRSVACPVWPFDQAWGTSVDVQTWTQTLPQNLFAASLLPYLGFLYHLHKATRATKAPGLMLFGFYFLLAFVGASIPAGIYAKKVYGLALANVDWLHGSAELLLTFTNLFIVLGLEQGIRRAQAAAAAKPEVEQVEPVAAPVSADK